MILNEMECIQDLQTLTMSSVIECCGKVLDSKKFFNGIFVGQGKIIPPECGCKTAYEAIQITKELINTIKKEYKNIWLLCTPELKEFDLEKYPEYAGKYYCRVVLAF